ncbi:MAG: hypothetical protein DVB23_000414 [Verrucomicrobia bacterium]|nr:MAG: hypothetical protein DVB23_000414 [Verrucomicrobiota bacterium]
MKTTSVFGIGLVLSLALGPFPGVAFARGNDAEAAIKEAEARLRASGPTSAPKKRVVAAPAPAPENLFSKLASAFGRPTTSARVATKAGATGELPEVTVRGAQGGRREGSRPSGADLRKLVSGIVMRLGPMQIEESDDAVMNPSADSLSLLAHPNIQPVIPVAPVPVPGSARTGKTEYAPNPLTEHRTSWLVAKVTEKLGAMEGAGKVPASSVAESNRTKVESAEPKVGPDRESIELMALLAVSGTDKAAAPRPVDKSEAESRVSALSLLASAGAGDEGPKEGEARERPVELKEQPLPSEQLLPIPAIKPAREIDSSSRNRVLMLLQPETLAGAP